MNNTYVLNIAKYHDMLVGINSRKFIYFLSLYLINFLWFPEKKDFAKFLFVWSRKFEACFGSVRIFWILKFCFWIFGFEIKGVSDLKIISRF